MAEVSAETRQAHWRKTSTLTYTILAIWFLFGYVVPWFAKDLDGASFLGFPLGYYFIVQGSLIVFVLLIVVQNFLQDNIDEEHGVADE